MTGLYNRKILTPELEQRLQKLVQSGSSVMFIAIDMDKLKQINDTLGHQEGDLAITLLAQAIKQSIRKSDYAIRLGGDEFCIILVDSTPQIAAQLPERIEKRLQHIAPQKEIGFSSGIYAMKETIRYMMRIKLPMSVYMSISRTKTAVHDNLLWLFACNLRSMK